jgi:copper chaperone CopZ
MSTEPTTADRDPAGVATIEFQVSGMHCGSCAALIEETLLGQPGVASASVDLDATRAVVGYDPDRVGADELGAAITGAGYPATAVG